MQRENFSLAPVKSPALRRAKPAAPHTPEGSRPHFVETSMASESRSASMKRSRRRLSWAERRKQNCEKLWSQRDAVLHQPNRHSLMIFLTFRG